MSNNAFILSDQTVTIIFEDGDFHTVTSDHPHFEKLKDVLKEGDYTKARSLIDLGTSIAEFSQGRLEVKGGVVYFDGEELHNAITQRILRMLEEGFEVEPMINFLSNLMDNPSGRAVKELYRFLECNRLPITPDGHFLAYKNVNGEYKDKHSNTFDNSVGATCEMPRNKVMDDPNQTCSAGLHFCSIEYLNTMWGHSGHTMIIKINPRDVVSIPVDYNNSKGRCCKYTVIAEHGDKEKDTLSDKVVYTSEEEEGWTRNPNETAEDVYPADLSEFVDVVVKLRDGSVDSGTVDDFDWSIDNGPADILWYKVR